MTRLHPRLVPALLSADLERTRAFYEQLGFAVTGRAEGWLEFDRDGVVLQFHSEPPVGTPSAPVLSGTLYLYPESVSALAEELSGKVPFAWGPEVMPYGMREFAVRDPDGYILAFSEPE